MVIFVMYLSNVINQRIKNVCTVNRVHVTCSRNVYYVLGNQHYHSTYLLFV